MNTQNFTINHSTAIKPHSFYCRQDSLGLSEEGTGATEVFKFEGEPLILDNQGGDFFDFELDTNVEQRTNTTLGNLLEVPDYKFGDAAPQPIEDASKNQSGPLNEICSEFSILGDELIASFDSEGEKSNSRVKGRTMAMEAVFAQDSESDIFDEGFFCGPKPRNSFKRKLNLAISGFKQSKGSLPIGKEFELGSTASNTRKGSNDSFDKFAAKNREISKNSYQTTPKSAPVKRRIKKRRKGSNNSARASSSKSLFKYGLDLNDLGKSMLKSKVLNRDAGSTCLKL
jgi:hypothetical protein